MLTRHTRGSVTWVDLESPTHDELADVMHEFNVDPRIEEEIISPTPYPVSIAFADYLYLILHFPTTEAAGGTRSQEVDFIVGKNFLITARYELIDSIHNLHKIFEAEELLGLPDAPTKADLLLERVLRRLYSAIGSEVEHVARALDRIERDIFEGKERATVRAISDTGRILLRFETTLARHKQPLETLLERLSAPEFFGKAFGTHAAHLAAERDHAASLVASYREVARELRVTNDSLLSSAQNEVMKTLTVVTFVLFPPIMIAAVFQIDADGTPFMNMSGGFWVILTIMGASALGLYLLAKFKKWL